MPIKIETLLTIPNVTEEIATSVLSVMRNQTDVEEFESVQTWLRQRFSRPSPGELKMCAINELLEGHGIEAHFKDGKVWPEFSYVNMGDACIPTIVLQQNGRKYGGVFRVACWGDIVEEMEQDEEDSIDEEQ